MSEIHPSPPPQYPQHTVNDKDMKLGIEELKRSDTSLTAQSETPFNQGPGPIYDDQMPPRPIRRSRFHVGRFWLWEIISVIVAAGLVAANISILAHYDGQKVPEWPFSINLNTLIALLSTILRAALLVAVAEIIGQVKYAYFAKNRRLEDIDAFDRASRSVTGSVKLLFVAPRALLAVLGALVTILSLAIGPFTQQAIKSVSCPMELAGKNASIPIAHFMPGRASYYRIGAGTWEVDTEMKGAMINGLTNPTGNDSAIVASCSTGNCTFPVGPDGVTHSTIGMCSACLDVTSFVTKNDTNDLRPNYTLPNDLWVSNYVQESYLGVMFDYDLEWASSAFTDSFTLAASHAMANMSLITLTQAGCTRPSEFEIECPNNVTGYMGTMDYVATACSLYPCMKNMFAEMDDGVLKETVVSTQPAPVNWIEAGVSEDMADYTMGGNYTALKSPCEYNGTYYEKEDFDEIPRPAGVNFTMVNVDGVNYTAPPECLYKMEKYYGAAVTRFMSQSIFTGTCSYNSAQGGQLYCGDSWWLNPMFEDENATYATITKHIDQFATAITNKFRQLGSDNYNMSSVEGALGLVIETTVCTSFDWRWLLLPGGLTAAAGTLLFLMMMQNYQDPEQPVWKSSVLPLLYHGFGPAKPAMDLDEMKGQAHHVRTRFQTGTDAGFVNLTHPGGAPCNDIDMDLLMANKASKR